MIHPLTFKGCFKEQWKEYWNLHQKEQPFTNTLKSANQSLWNMTNNTLFIKLKLKIMKIKRNSLQNADCPKVNIMLHWQNNHQYIISYKIRKKQKVISMFFYHKISLKNHSVIMFCLQRYWDIVHSVYDNYHTKLSNMCAMHNLHEKLLVQDQGYKNLKKKWLYYKNCVCIVQPGCIIRN